ncbi:hypothetical protein BC938DRAFT_476979 [Jimgerdemannia flammicorona]|uniref:Uncharacterized protein n=1 Tax=Jimgerdemannia flammicorona TaxID=994334 RepID=A0A433PCV3_9FUNG|nr:hypothetical protein BC938DRAFT_476979 [Jimgerdemannia flammicorona]
MSSSKVPSAKHKYTKLREKYYVMSRRKEELLEELDAAKVKIRRLKQENNYLLELMMEMDPDLAKDASDSSADENDISPLSTEEEERRTVTDEDDVREDDSETTSDRDLQHTMPDREGELVFRLWDNNAPRGRSKQRGKRKIVSSRSPHGSHPPTKRRRRTGKRDDRTQPKHVESLPATPDGQLKLPVTVGKGNNEVTIVKIGG